MPPNPDYLDTTARLGAITWFLLGAVLPMIICAIILFRHDAALNEEVAEAREHGRRRGYEQCWKEMVEPIRPSLTPLAHNRPDGLAVLANRIASRASATPNRR